MMGTYNIYDGGQLISTSRNIITTEGKEAVLRFFAGERSDFGDYMAFGIGEALPTVDDTTLAFEYYRGELDLKQSQIDASKVVVRGTVPDQIEFSIYEVGIVLDEDLNDTASPNTLVTTFDVLDEGEWTMYDGASTSEEGFEYAGGRTGPSSFNLDVPAGGTWSLRRSGDLGGLEGLQSNDVFALAYETLSGSANDIELRLRTDESNYYSYSFVPAAGFSVNRWTKGDFSLTGSATWNNITSLEVVVSSAAGANVVFEGLRYDMLTGEERPILVSRTVLPEPVHKRNTSELQIEYVLDIGFSVNGV